MQELSWVKQPNPPGYKEPAWKLSAAIADDGTIFVPAAIAGNEKSILMLAISDGVSVVVGAKPHLCSNKLDDSQLSRYSRCLRSHRIQMQKY